MSSPYGHRYKTIRAALIGLPCQLMLKCEGDPADSADHSPPLSRHHHVEGSGCCSLRPACLPCQYEQARVLSMETKAAKRMGVIQCHHGHLCVQTEPDAYEEVGRCPDCGPFDHQLVQSVEWS